MSAIHLLPVGSTDGPLLDRLRRGLEQQLRVSCQILPQRLDPGFAFHAERQQYHSTQLLARLPEYAGNSCWRILGVTANDLYMPILTFVFGEAQLAGPCAVVSWHRLTQDFYGMPPDADLLTDRLLKEAVHELGHTLGLTHCQDYNCVMAASHSVEWIDIKGSAFCKECSQHASATIPAKRVFGIW